MNMGRISVVGLGAMGMGMARALLRAGHEVAGADIDPARVAALATEGGRPVEADTPAQTDILVLVVLNAAQSRAVLGGPNGWLAGLGPGAVVISCATMAPDEARALAAEAEAAGIDYLDAPISGGAVRADEGALSVMAAGSEAAFARAGPALDAMAATVHRLGDAPGAGSAMKAVNQLLAGVHIAAMGEAMTLGMAHGLAPERIVEVISASAGTSWMFENRAPHVVEGDYAPRSAIDIWPKDLGIVCDMADAAGFDPAVARAALAQFRAASAQGLGDVDDAVITRLYAGPAGVRLPGEG